MNIKMLFKSAVKGAIEHIDVICAVASCACTIMAAVEGAKAGMKSETEINYAWYDRMQETGNEEDFTFKEKLQLTWKNYIPCALYTVGALTCTFGCYKAGSGKLAAANAAYSILSGKLTEYEQIRNEKLLAERDLENIPKSKKKELAIDDSFEVYEPYSQQYFRTTREEMLWAEIAINKAFQNKTRVTINELLGMFHNAKQVPYGDDLGWGSGNDMWDWNWSFCYGAPWINLGLAQIEHDGRSCMALTYAIEPDDISCPF